MEGQEAERRIRKKFVFNYTWNYKRTLKNNSPPYKRREIKSQVAFVKKEKAEAFIGVSISPEVVSKKVADEMNEPTADQESGLEDVVDGHNRSTIVPTSTGEKEFIETRKQSTKLKKESQL